MDCLVTLWSLPREVRVPNPSAKLFRIAKTFSGVNLDDGCASPRVTFSGYFLIGFLSPVRLLFFAIMSSMLSWWLPRNKWSMLVHSLKSHLWQTIIPSGMAPLAITQATRCAFTVFLLSLKAPYPWNFPPFQGQHSCSDFFSTFSQNRTMSDSLRLMGKYLRGSLEASWLMVITWVELAAPFRQQSNGVALIMAQNASVCKIISHKSKSGV